MSELYPSSTCQVQVRRAFIILNYQTHPRIPKPNTEIYFPFQFKPTNTRLSVVLLIFFISYSETRTMDPGRLKWKFLQWEMSCSMWTDGHDEINSHGVVHVSTRRPTTWPRSPCYHTTIISASNINYCYNRDWIHPPPFLPKTRSRFPMSTAIHMHTPTGNSVS